MKFNKEGNTLYYDLQNYLYLNEMNKLSENAIIILPISYFVFGLDENRLDRLPDQSFVNEFYHYLPSEQIFSYSKTKKRNLLIYTIQRNFKNLFNSKDKKINKNVSEEKLINHARDRVINHKRLSNYCYKEKNMVYINSLIESILKNGHKPILISSPYHYSYNKNFDQDWLKNNYFSIVQKLSKKFDIPYIDYSHDERFSNNSLYFYNSDHLNNLGRKKFSKIVFNEILK